MYGLTADDLRIQNTARAFVESLMPHEVEAELAGGLLPKELTAEHAARAIKLGLYATNMPASVGGPGLAWGRAAKAQTSPGWGVKRSPCCAGPPGAP